MKYKDLFSLKKKMTNSILECRQQQINLTLYRVRVFALCDIFASLSSYACELLEICLIHFVVKAVVNANEYDER